MKEEASNICVNVLSNFLEGNLEMHKHGAHQLMMETWKKHTWKMVQKLAQSKVHLETNIHFHAIMFRNHTKFVFAQHMQKPFHIQN
jgi:hypothetical protein